MNAKFEANCGSRFEGPDKAEQKKPLRPTEGKARAK